MKKHSTKRALLMSALAMLLCMSMLVGSTFAWFTDSVVSANNKIKAGTLDVQLLMHNGTEYVDISDSTKPIFGEGSIAQNNNAETLWEPGKTQVAYLAIKNNGSLALKYQVGLNVVNVAKDLYEVMEYVITPDAQQGAVTAWDGTNAKTCTVGTQIAANDVSLAVGATHYFALSIHMQEEAGNEYQAGEVLFDLTVLATQDTVEKDSFDDQYDVNATYPEVAGGSANVDPSEDWYEIDLLKADGGKVGSALVPAAAVADGAEAIKITVTPSDPYTGVTVTSDQKAQGFEITATGLKTGTFTTPVKIELGVGDGLTGVKVYHYGELIESSYNDGTDNVVFETTSFSPFTVVYDAVAQEQSPALPEDLPKAGLVRATEFENVAITWNDDLGLVPGNTDQQLNAVYTFTSPDTSVTVETSPYKDWYCDFYVKMETTSDVTVIPEGAITLGGNYGDFGWVGFDNPEVDSNEFFPLLSSVGSPWTYESVVDLVGEFMCGVGEANPSIDLSGMTFVVQLRLVNPETDAANQDELQEYMLTTDNYHVVKEVRYTFN